MTTMTPGPASPAPGSADTVSADTVSADAVSAEPASPPPPHDDPLEHVRYQIGNAPLRTYPYEHLWVEDVFTPEYYDALRAHFPDGDAFRALSDLFPRRGSIELTDPAAVARLAPRLRSFWQSFLDRFASPAFIDFALERYGDGIARRYRRRVAPMIFLFRDDGQYAIGPHTDVVSKVVTMLFYLPSSGETRSCGTSILVPRRDDFEHDHTDRGSWDDYLSAKTVPFQPNAMLSFLVTDRSLHAVRPLPPGAVRTSLQYFIVMP